MIIQKTRQKILQSFDKAYKNVHHIQVPKGEPKEISSVKLWS